MTLIHDVLFASFLIGLLGAGHCFGMCGGIIGALSLSSGQTTSLSRFQIIVYYNVGRILSYSMIGFFVGAFGEQLISLTGSVIPRITAGVLLVLMGLYVSNVWRVLVRLEKVGEILWRYIQPFAHRLLPIQSPIHAILVGSMWGWLPCGLVYTALAYATAQADAVKASLVMLAFGLGTLPALIAGGVIGNSLNRVVKSQHFRWTSAVLLILFGIYTVVSALEHASHLHHHGHHSDNHHH